MINSQTGNSRPPGLPLAVYREVAAHLQQVEGVETGLLPQTAQRFAIRKARLVVFGLSRLRILILAVNVEWKQF